MLIFLRETGFEKVNRIIDAAHGINSTVETIELPEKSYIEFINIKRNVLKIDSDSININSIPNKVIFEDIRIQLSEELHDPFYMFDNYLSSYLQPITEEVKIDSATDGDDVLLPSIKRIIENGTKIEIIHATSAEYLLLRQANCFEIKFEYLRLANIEWRPKAGDRYHPTIGGQRISVQIV